MRDAFVRRLLKHAEADKRIMLLTGDLGFGVLDEFSRKLPSQFLNVGVAEQNMTGIATGLALDGKIVFTYSIANFSTLRCLEQIRNDAAYHGANVKVVSIGAGFSYGALGVSHHATEDISIMRGIPEITIFSPATLQDVEQAVDTMLRIDGTCYLRLDKSQATLDGSSVSSKAFGSPQHVFGGNKHLIFATGGILQVAIDSARMLLNEGLDVGVVNVPKLKPFENSWLKEISSNCVSIFTLEEHVLQGGLGSILAESLMDLGIYPKIFHRFGIDNRFTTEVGSQDYLRRVSKLDRDSIAASIRSRITK